MPLGTFGKCAIAFCALVGHALIATPLLAESAQPRLPRAEVESLLASESSRATGLSELQRSIDAGASWAKARMAEIYRKGDLGVDQDPAKAMVLYRELADSGNVGARRALAAMIIRGEGVPADFTAGVAMLASAADAQNADVLYDLAGYFSDPALGHVDPIVALEYLQRADAAGSMSAKLTLADIYRSGDLGVAKAPDRAAALYEGAAAAGNVGAQRKLAAMLITGELGNPDFTKGVEVLSTAAADANPSVLFDLGKYYSEPKFGHVDVDLARTYFERSAAADYIPAKARMGELYRNGELGVPADPAKAVAIFEDLAKVGHNPSRRTLATMLINGEGTDADFSAGIALATAAAEDNDAGALYDLGLYYSDKGLGHVDVGMAHDFFLKGAEAGNFPSIVRLLKDLAANNDYAAIADAASAYIDKAAPARRKDALFSIIRIAPNLFVHLVQRRMIADGLFYNDATGLLTRRTITAMKRICEERAPPEICDRGPLSAPVGRLLAEYATSEPASL